MIEIPAPVLFYLKHQQMIDEWAALAKEVPALAHDFYVSLKPGLEKQASGLEGRPTVFATFEGAYPKLFLVGATWGGSKPRAAVGLEWLRKSSGFTAAYTGVWVRYDAPRGKELHDAVVARISDLGPPRSLRVQRTWWPLWRYETPRRSDYWTDLDGFGRDLVDTICEWWNVFHSRVDDAVAEVAEPEPGAT